MFHNKTMRFFRGQRCLFSKQLKARQNATKSIIRVRQPRQPYQGERHITKRSDSLSWHTSLYAWREFGSKKLNTPERQKVDRRKCWQQTKHAKLFKHRRKKKENFWQLWILSRGGLKFLRPQYPEQGGGEPTIKQGLLKLSHIPKSLDVILQGLLDGVQVHLGIWRIKS